MPFRPCVVIHSASFSHLKVYCTVCTLLEKWVIEFSIIYQFIVCDTYILYSVYVLYSVECSVIYNFSFSHQQQEHKFCKNSTWFSISVCSTVFALFLTHMLPALCSTVCTVHSRMARFLHRYAIRPCQSSSKIFFNLFVFFGARDVPSLRNIILDGWGKKFKKQQNS